MTTPEPRIDEPRDPYQTGRCPGCDVEQDAGDCELCADCRGCDDCRIELMCGNPGGCDECRYGRGDRWRATATARIADERRDEEGEPSLEDVHEFIRDFFGDEPREEDDRAGGSDDGD